MSVSITTLPSGSIKIEQTGKIPIYVHNSDAIANVHSDTQVRIDIAGISYGSQSLLINVADVTAPAGPFATAEELCDTLNAYPFFLARAASA